MKIILTGTYNSCNKGDAAMELAAAQALEHEFPGAEITVNSPFPQIDSEFYYDYKVFFSSRRRLIYATLQLIFVKIFSFFHKVFNIELNFLLISKELRTFNHSDFVIDLSGDMLTEDYGPHVTYSHFIPILFALSLNKPVFLCAQSIGPFKFTKFLAKYIFKKVAFISVREEITLKYLEKIGINKKKLLLTADIAFLLPASNASTVNKILFDENINFNKQKVLGISLSQLVERKFNNIRKSNSPDFACLMANFLDQIINKYKISVLFVSHVVGPNQTKDDRIIAAKVKNIMQNKEGVFLLKGNYRPEELKGIISHCDFFIGTRMHANIAALSSAIPLIAISYSHKTLGIMKMFSQEDMVYPFEKLTLNGLIIRFDKIIRTPKMYSTILNKKFQYAKEKAQKNIKKIKEYINNMK